MRPGGSRLAGIALVEKAIEVSGAWEGRPRDSEGRPGGLVELAPGLRPVIIGDLHADLAHLEAIIAHGRNLEDLEGGRAVLIFVGDSVHDDRGGRLADMKSSVEMLDFILRLIVEFPKGIIYLRGNHDSFDGHLWKGGVAQGLEFRRAVLAAEGPAYLEAVQRHFDSLPLLLVGEGFVVVHAGPPRGGIGRGEVIDIRRHPDKLQELIWNRVGALSGRRNDGEYGESDLRLAIEGLGLAPETIFIVGHNPLRLSGERSGVWLDAAGIRNHHIIISGSGTKAPYFTTEAGKLVVRFAAGQT